MTYRIEDIGKLGHARVVKRHHIPDQPETIALPPRIPTVAPTIRTMPTPCGLVRKKRLTSRAAMTGVFKRDITAAPTGSSSMSRVQFRRRRG